MMKKAVPDLARARLRVVAVRQDQLPNPVERVWLYLKERFLSHRLLADYEAIADAACRAWNRLVAETGRITLLASYPWILQVKP